MSIRGVGIDIVETKRFIPFAKDRKNRFLSNNFTADERTYCFSFKNPEAHLAGIFAAKESVCKAFGKRDLLCSAVEIRHEKNGMPTAWIKGRRQRSIFVSISHEKTVAVGVALKI